MQSTVDRSGRERGEEHSRRALSGPKRRLLRLALEAVVFVVLAYLLLRLVPTLKLALHSLAHVSGLWVAGAIALEVVSETGFVFAWRAIVDPEKVLDGEGRGNRIADRVAWAQLGGGLLVPGVGGLGMGVWILHRFGMPTELIARRQFNLSFLNTAVAALALVVFGVGLATGLFAGERNLLLTLLPAALAAAGLAAALAMALRLAAYAGGPRGKHPKIAGAIKTLANAVEDTNRILFHRGDWRSLLGAVTYFGFEVLVLWTAFFAVHAHPVPGFGVVVMAYVIGALGGWIPLPASLGMVGGIAGMLIVYRVDHNPAVAAVLLQRAIGLLVPFAGGGIAYALLRRRLGPLRRSPGDRSGEA